MPFWSIWPRVNDLKLIAHTWLLVHAVLQVAKIGAAASICHDILLRWHMLVLLVLYLDILLLWCLNLGQLNSVPYWWENVPDDLTLLNHLCLPRQYPDDAVIDLLLTASLKPSRLFLLVALLWLLLDHALEHDIVLPM